MRKDVALYLILLGGFASLFLDVRYEHRDVLAANWQAYIPLVASGVAILATLIAFSRSRVARTVSAVLFACIAVVGLLGVYFHTKMRPYMFTRYVTPVSDDLKGLERPTIAPLSYTGLGIVVLIVVLPAFRWPKPVSETTEP